MSTHFAGSPLPMALAAFVHVQGAPCYTLFGAYFPAWMFCATFGILVAILARVAFVAAGVATVLPLQLFVCAAVGLSAAVFAGLRLFGL